MSRETDVLVKLGLNTATFAASAREMAAKVEAFAASFGRMAALRSRPVLVVDDPSDERPTTLRAWLDQARAIMLHEFWMAAGEPERSPGARWIRPQR